MNENSASDIERMLEQMAEKAACKQLETERLKELNEAAQSISYGDIHSGVDIKVHRISQVDSHLEDQYHLISGPLLDISKQLQRNLVQKLKDQQRGGKQTGLVMGRRLDAHALCRNDGKVFYKNNLPNEIPRISVGLLLDESGSMSCGDRSTYARAAAIILYDFCQSLNIPIMVYGHSTSGRGVDLYSYAEFDSTVIAVPGVNSLNHLRGTLEYVQSKGTTRIMTVFDMDYLKNPHVKDGYYNLATLLAEIGIDYGTYLWDPQYKGLDDYVWHCCQEGLL